VSLRVFIRPVKHARFDFHNTFSIYISRWSSFPNDIVFFP
jgi:hypothetical protein